MRKTQIKTCQFHCAGKCWCLSQRIIWERGTCLLCSQTGREQELLLTLTSNFCALQDTNYHQECGHCHLATASHPVFDSSCHSLPVTAAVYVPAGLTLPIKGGQGPTWSFPGFWGLRGGSFSIYCLCTNTCLGLQDVKIVFFAGTQKMKIMFVPFPSLWTLC